MVVILRAVLVIQGYGGWRNGLGGESFGWGGGGGGCERRVWGCVVVCVSLRVCLRARAPACVVCECSARVCVCQCVFLSECVHCVYSACMCVCVCVCVRERERERELKYKESLR